jgi:small-conductance mechanosensitive channel
MALAFVFGFGVAAAVSPAAPAAAQQTAARPQTAQGTAARPQTAPSPPAAAAARPADPEPAAVRLRGTDLFRIRTPLGSLSPSERAELAGRKLTAALRDPAIGPENVVTRRAGDLVLIEAGPLQILEVGPADAAAHGSEPAVLADMWAGLIRKELDRRKKEAFSLILLGRWIGKMMYPAAILLLLWVGSILLDRIAARVATRPADSLPALNVLGITLLSPLAVRRLLRRSVQALKIFLYLGGGYAFLAVLFAQFPRTQAYAWDMLVFVADLLAGLLGRLLDWVPPLVAAILLVAAARLAFKLNGLLFARIRAGRSALPPGLGRDNVALTETIVRVLILLATLVLLAILIPGEGGRVILAVLFLLLLIAALALVPSARQAVAGILLAYIHPAPSGSRIDVEGTRGTVVRRDLLHTVLRADDGSEIWLPHQDLIGRRVVLLSAPDGPAPDGTPHGVPDGTPHGAPDGEPPAGDASGPRAGPEPPAA